MQMMRRRIRHSSSWRTFVGRFDLAFMSIFVLLFRSGDVVFKLKTPAGCSNGLGMVEETGKSAPAVGISSKYYTAFLKHKTPAPPGNTYPIHSHFQVGAQQSKVKGAEPDSEPFSSPILRSRFVELCFDFSPDCLGNGRMLISSMNQEVGFAILAQGSILLVERVILKKVQHQIEGGSVENLGVYFAMIVEE
jgi:hypothetical protein